MKPFKITGLPKNYTKTKKTLNSCKLSTKQQAKHELLFSGITVTKESEKTK